MHTIGITGPLNLHSLADYIDPSFGQIPEGSGGTGLPPLIVELLKRGQKCIVFALDKRISEQVNINGDLLRICISPRRKNHRARDFFAQERISLVHSMEKENVDLINAHWTYEYAMAALNTKIPAIVTARDAPMQILRYNFSPYRFVKTILASEVIRKTKNLIAVSPYIQQHIQKYFGYHKIIPVIPNGLSADIFSMVKTKEYNPNGKVVFASVANDWGRLKNVQTLLQAFLLLRKSFPKAELWLFGKDFVLNGPAEKWSKVHGLADGVCYCGLTEYKKMLQVMSSQVDVLVHPSLEESFSNAIVEALSLGLPVIGGEKSGAVPGTLGYGEAGILVDVRSAKKISGAMIELASDIKKRKFIGESGRSFAQKHFRIEQVADQYQSQYHKLLTLGSDNNS